MLPRNINKALFSMMQLVSDYRLTIFLEVTLQKMLKDKKDAPDKKIPNNFERFVNSEEFKALLEAMLDYCRELFRLENKQNVLE
jgi:hypothetical protein